MWPFRKRGPRPRVFRYERFGGIMQLERPRAPTPGGIYSGLVLLLLGLFKKVAIADNLAPYVDAVYANPAANSGKTLLFATYLFAFQIYCDFNGYSDMAVGMSRMLGIELIYNFRAPYLARSPKEFWRRWHISLSTWFRDYLYIPLGGNRLGPRRDALNLMAVFLVSGLWHGANWTFIIWGGLNGLYIMCSQLTEKYQEKVAAAFHVIRWRSLAHLLQVLFTFALICISFIFFRAQSIRDALAICASFIHIPSDLPAFLRGWRNYFTPNGLGIGLKPFMITLVAIVLLETVQFIQAKKGTR